MNFHETVEPAGPRTSPRTRRRRGHLLELAKLDPRHRPVGIPDQDRNVEDADDAAVFEIQKQRLNLAGGRLLARARCHSKTT